MIFGIIETLGDDVAKMMLIDGALHKHRCVVGSVNFDQWVRTVLSGGNLLFPAALIVLGVFKGRMFR